MLARVTRAASRGKVAARAFTTSADRKIKVENPVVELDGMFSHFILSLDYFTHHRNSVTF